jgi:hypothetical protein
MGFTEFERFFRKAGQVRVDRDDVKRYLDFVNDVIYDMLLIGQATAKANARDIIEPWDPPITAGLQQCMHQFGRIDEDIELRPILDSLAARPRIQRRPDTHLRSGQHLPASSRGGSRSPGPARITSCPAPGASLRMKCASSSETAPG